MTTLGKVVLVGAGPGDLDLLTLKGKEYIKQADCIIYDRLLNSRMLKVAKDSCEKIFVGKANHHHTVPQDEINAMLFEKAKEHKLVVRLKGGDPYVFGRGGEEAIFLKERGVEVEVVPGVSSPIAALSAAGIPITHRGLSKGFQVITAHSKKDALADIDYSQLMDENVTLVFLMGLAHVAEIAKGLIDAGRSTDTSAAVISNGTTNHQKKVVGTLENIGRLVEEAGLLSPAIIVVGKVVSLADELDFFEKRPLFGKKYLLPKIISFNYSLSRGIYEDNLNELELSLVERGAEVLAPVSGRIAPVECDLAFLKAVTADDYIVFTSGNGVRSFFWNLFEKLNLDLRIVGQAKFAVVGKKTAEVIKQFGVKADLIPERQTGGDLAKLINESANAGANIFWLCGKEQAPDFEKTLSSELNLKKIVCYENILEEIELSEEELSEIKDYDGAILTSGSNAAALSKVVAAFPEKVYSIGPTCTGVLKSAGVSEIIEAKESSYNGLLQHILSK